MKRIQWLGDTPERIREFRAPRSMRQAGYQRERVQAGKAPADWKPMPSIGLGVNEIRVRESGAFRAIYVAKSSEAVYVLHAFQKKTRRTLKADTDLANERYTASTRSRQRFH